jgi:uncharacterized protein
VIVVGDTSPLRALAAVQLLPVLHALYGEVIIPPAVADELSRAAPPVPPVDLAGLSFIRVVAPRDMEKVAVLLQSLGRGEAEAIELASEIHADLVLIDETKARRIAARHGLQLIGVLGILVKAKSSGLVQRISPLLDTLSSTINFRVSQTLRERALREAGEL